MAILQAVADTAGLQGLVPRIVRINCNDTLATVLASNYLLPLVTSQGLALNTTDLIFISFSGGEGLFNVALSAGNVNLSLAYAYNAAMPLFSYANNITAHAMGGQTNAFPLVNLVNQIKTVASGNDSVILPASNPGSMLVVSNNAASNSAAVFPQSGDQINALGANNAFTLAANKSALFACAVAGQWNAILTA